jgi:hypothetical protein
MTALGEKVDRLIRSVGRGVWIAVGAVLALAVVLYFTSDAILRRTIERGINQHLKGYSAHVGAAHFHLFGFSIDLVDTRVAQNAHPDPPVMDLPRLHASVQWQALLRLRVVADFLLDGPRFYLNLPQFRAEENDPTPVADKGWQQALEAIYPLKINVFRIRNAEVVYKDEGPYRPLHLSHLELRAGNIRNIASPNDAYPSTLSVEAVVFDTGRLSLDGRANFLAVPHVTMKGAYTLDRIALDYFKPIAAKYNLQVQGGSLASSGNFEYATQTSQVHVQKAEIRHVEIEYVHASETAGAEQRQAHQVKRSVKEASNSPATSLTLDQLDIAQSTLGFRNDSGKPPYRLFVSDASIHLSNVTNRGEWGQARGAASGKFMGSGPTVIDLNLKPQGKQMDMDLAVKIEGTDLTTLNRLLQDVAGFDVSAGSFAFYSQASIRQSHVQGYIKPIFTDVKVVDPDRQGREALVKRIKERLADLVARILKNPNQEIATTVTLKGNIGDPQYSTWEAVGGLLKNAFLEPLLHRFGRG